MVLLTKKRCILYRTRITSWPAPNSIKSFNSRQPLALPTTFTCSIPAYNFPIKWNFESANALFLRTYPHVFVIATKRIYQFWIWRNVVSSYSNQIIIIFGNVTLVISLTKWTYARGILRQMWTGVSVSVLLNLNKLSFLFSRKCWFCVPEIKLLLIKLLNERYAS